MIKAYIVLVVAALAAACADDLSSPPRVSHNVLSSRRDAPPGVGFLDSNPPTHSYRAFSRSGTAGSGPDTIHAISYHGGPIIYAQKLAAVYWSYRTIYQGGPAPGDTGRGSADHSLIGFLLNNLSGSPYYNSNTTYYDGTGTYIQNSVAYTQYWADTVEAPPPGDYPSPARIQTQLEIGFINGWLTYDPNTLYLVFGDSAVDLGNYLEYNFCARHTHFYLNGYGDVKYAIMPHDYDWTPCIVQSGSPNNDPAADVELNALVHEIEETNTDPQIPGPSGAWYDVDSLEVGDKCWKMFGVTYPVNGGGANANVHLGGVGGKDFYIQRDWENARLQQCALFSLSMSGPSGPPTAGTYTWNASPGGGGSAYTYQWLSQNQGSSTWDTLGTGQLQSLNLDGSGPNFTLQVVATLPLPNRAAQTQAETLFVNSPPHITVSGPSVITQKGTYTYTTSIMHFGGTPSYTWYQRYCDGTSCPAWTYAAAGRDTFPHTLTPDCSGDSLADYQVEVAAAYGSQSATNSAMTRLCQPGAGPVH